MLGRAWVLLFERGIHQRQPYRYSNGIDHYAYDCHHERYRGRCAEDRLQHGESEESYCRRAADKGTNGCIGAGVFLEHAEHEVNRHEAGHDAYCRNQSELDILNKVLAGCLHNRYKQSGRKGIVKHYLIEFLGIVAGEYTLLSGDISGEHHHDDRDDGI